MQGKPFWRAKLPLPYVSCVPRRIPSGAQELCAVGARHHCFPPSCLVWRVFSHASLPGMETLSPQYPVCPRHALRLSGRGGNLAVGVGHTRSPSLCRGCRLSSAGFFPESPYPACGSPPGFIASPCGEITSRLLSWGLYGCVFRFPVRFLPAAPSPAPSPAPLPDTRFPACFPSGFAASPCSGAIPSRMSLCIRPPFGAAVQYFSGRRPPPAELTACAGKAR